MFNILVDVASLNPGIQSLWEEKGKAFGLQVLTPVEVQHWQLKPRSVLDYQVLQAGETSSQPFQKRRYSYPGGQPESTSYAASSCQR